MPTHGDETLHDRYTREHLAHLARIATMTPDQIAAMELDLHNALAEVDRLRAQLPSQGGEAVAWRVTGRDGLTVTAQYPEWAEADCLLTITPLYTHPADQVAEGVRLDGLVLANQQMGRIYLHFKTTEQQHVALRELRALLAKPCQHIPLTSQYGTWCELCETKLD